MRKKSHISLANGILNGLDLSGLVNHRFTFYLGSIWPDCIPSFITRRHNIDETFDIFNKQMNKFVAKFKPDKSMGIVQTLRMGVVMHYIADYFTFPHNKHYPGSLKDHCVYEEGLKKRMYKFIADEKSKHDRGLAINLPKLASISEISEFIKEKHEQYMNIDGNVESDCMYSFKACMVVVRSLLSIARDSAGVSVAAA